MARSVACERPLAKPEPGEFSLGAWNSFTRLGIQQDAADFYDPRMPPAPLSGGDRESFRGTSSKKMDFAHRSDVEARSGSRELRAVKVLGSHEAWRPPTGRKNDSAKLRFLFVLEISFSYRQL